MESVAHRPVRTLEIHWLEDAVLWSNRRMPPTDDAGPHDATSGSAERRGMDLQEYLDAQAAAGGHSTIPFSDIVRPFMSAVRLRAKQVATAVMAPMSRRRARDRAATSPLRLHLGSGGNNSFRGG